jgi:hypothetical protein
MRHRWIQLKVETHENVLDGGERTKTRRHEMLSPDLTTEKDEAGLGQGGALYLFDI